MKYETRVDMVYKKKTKKKHQNRNIKTKDNG